MMRIIVLSVVAVCACVTSVEAQVAQQVVVTSGGGLPLGANGSHYGCCSDDVNHCMELWANYCQERKTHRGWSHRRLGGCHHGGIFGHCPDGQCGHQCSQCGPAEESAPCDRSDCVGSGYSDNDGASGAELNAPEDLPLDAAEDIQDRPPLAPPIPSDDGSGIVPPEPAPDTGTDSAGRWYLPFIWKK